MRSHRLTLSAAALPLALLASPAAAHAEWIRGGPGGGAYLSAVSAPTASELVVCGYTVDTSNIFAPLTTKVYRSEDGGGTFEDISGTLDDTPGLLMPNAVARVDARHAFVALGTTLARTADGGATWESTELGFDALAVHFFDAQRGLVAGTGGHLARTEDGGATFEPLNTGTAVDLHALFFPSPRLGWVAGYNEVTESDPFGEQADSTTLSAGVVLQTTDAGETFVAGPPHEGRGLGPMVFLGDHTTGFLAAWERPDPQQNMTKAHLLSTKDGGATWQERPLPEAVGQLDLGGFGKSPIPLARLLGLSFDDARRGHLVGYGWLGESTEGQSGGQSSVTVRSVNVRIIDLETTDGGATFDHTDLGDIVIEGFPPVPPPGDGQLAAGVMVDRHRGFLVADQGLVWRGRTPCAGDAACGEGYACSAGMCVASAGGGEGGFGGEPSAGGSGPGTGGSGAGGTTAGAAGEDGSGGSTGFPGPFGPGNGGDAGLDGVDGGAGSSGGSVGCCFTPVRARGALWMGLVSALGVWGIGRRRRSRRPRRA